MYRRTEELLCIADFHNLSQIHDHDLVGQMLDNAQIVGNKQIGDEDRQCDEDKAVIIDPGGNALLVQPRFFGLGLQFRVLTHTFTSPSVACITLVAYSMTLSSVISSRGRMVWICPW